MPRRSDSLLVLGESDTRAGSDDSIDCGAREHGLPRCLTLSLRMLILLG
jgi:hypothetical protein